MGYVVSHILSANNLDSKCKSKSPKTKRLQKSDVQTSSLSLGISSLFCTDR
jgi:hypothetical protein